MPNVDDKFVLKEVRFSQGLDQFKGIDILIYHEHHKLMGSTRSEDNQDILVWYGGRTFYFYLYFFVWGKYFPAIQHTLGASKK